MSARRPPDGHLIDCMECGGPWGVFGVDRGAALVEAFDAWWEELEDWPSGPLPHQVVDLPAPRTAQVFWISEASAAWLEDRVGFDLEVIPDSWNVYWAGAVPAWWVKGRLRPVTTWDCCDLPTPMEYLLEVAG